MLKKSTRRCTVATHTPELPKLSDITLVSSIMRTISGAMVSPQPHACDITRFFCRVERSCSPMDILQSEPKPVVMP